MNRAILCLFGLLLSISLLKATQLNGRVYSDRGQPAANVIVVVQRTVATPTYQTYRLLTDSHGKFDVDLPEPGAYAVCAGAFDRGLLNSCEWTPDQSVVTITANQKNAQMLLRLVTGIRLYFRLNDSQHVLPAPGTLESSNSVGFGVWSSDGRFHPAVVISADDAGQNHQVLVPLGSDFRITAHSQNFHVLDGTANQIDQGPGKSVHSEQVESSQFHQFAVAPR